MKLVYQKPEQFLANIFSAKWRDLRKDTKYRVFEMFASRGLVREYVDVCYGELDLLTALKLIK